MSLYLVHISIECAQSDFEEVCKGFKNYLSTCDRWHPWLYLEREKNILHLELTIGSKNPKKWKRWIRQRIFKIPRMPTFRIAKIEILQDPNGEEPLESRQDGLKCNQQGIVGTAPDYVL